MSTELRSVREILAETELGRELERRLREQQAERLDRLLAALAEAITECDREAACAIRGELHEVAREQAAMEGELEA